MARRNQPADDPIAFQRELDDWYAPPSMDASAVQPRKWIERLLRALMQLMSVRDRTQDLEAACQADYRKACNISGSYADFLWSTMAIKARNAAASIKDPDLRLRVLLIGARYTVLAERAKMITQDDSEAMGRHSS